MMNVDLTTAPLNRRLLAGAFDLGAVALISFGYFLIPAVLLGLVLPMWGVLLAVIGYSVVPLAVFRQTLGMRLFGTELIGKDGHPVGLADVLFRELMGRGLFPAAFLFTAVAGVVASLLHVAAFGMPSGFFGLFFLVCGFALALAVLGHFLALNRPDGRTLADLMARSYVVKARPRLPPVDADAEDLAELKAAHARRVRGVVIAEVLMLTVAFGLPWVLTQRTESAAQRSERLLRGKLESQFKQDRLNEQVANELQRAYLAIGETDKAQQVGRDHQAALARVREQALAVVRGQFDAHPGDEQTFLKLLKLLVESDLPAAHLAYERFIAEHPHESAYRAGYADWLQSNGFAEDALTQMRGVLADEPDFPGVHTFLADALVATDHLQEAQEEYARALVLDPDDDDALNGQAELDAKLGPLSDKRLAELKKGLSAPLPK